MYAKAIIWYPCGLVYKGGFGPLFIAPGSHDTKVVSRYLPIIMSYLVSVVLTFKGQQINKQ